MSASVPSVDAQTLQPDQVAKIWVRHLTSLFFPVLSLSFLWTGPHAWYLAALFMLPAVGIFVWDTTAHDERRQPVVALPAWPFDALVYLLTGLHFLILFELIRFFSVQGVFSADLVMLFLVVGANSGFSIITAHELIHRRKPWEQWLGRLMLCTVLYEHFYTEHLRGHHARVGTPEDPATARFGESYSAFFRRTLPAQFQSAWKLEAKRLGDESMRLFDRRMLKNRVLHGLVIGWGIAFAVLAGFGYAAFAAYLLQAWVAIRLLEAVNYFEHWGLMRRQAQVSFVDSWDTYSWFTYYGLTGLSRHADHHAFPVRPYQQLRVFEEAPALPVGYIGSVDAVFAKNDDFMKTAAIELGRRGLGPFEEPGVSGEEALARLGEARQQEDRIDLDRRATWKKRLSRSWKTVPMPARLALVFAIILVGTTAGVQWETGGGEMGFGSRTGLHAWIFGSLAIVIPVRRYLGAHAIGEISSWGVALAMILALGVCGDAIFY